MLLTTAVQHTDPAEPVWIFENHTFVLMGACFSLFVCSASGCAEWKENMEEEDREEVFMVELHRGPHGLGLALVDGMVRPRFPFSSSRGHSPLLSFVTLI